MLSEKSFMKALITDIKDCAHSVICGTWLVCGMKAKMASIHFYYLRCEIESGIRKKVITKY